MKVILQPKYFIPALLAAALLGLAFGMTDMPEVWRSIRGMSRPHMLKALWLVFCLLVFKGLQFKLLLMRVGVDLGWRKLLVAYAVGQMAQQLPAGVYAQNYILRQVHGTRFSISAAATTGSIIIEVAAAMFLLLILGIPHLPWLRPLLWLLLLGLLLALAAFVHSKRLFMELGRGRSGAAGALGRGVARLADAMHGLVTDPTLAAAVVLGLCYMGFLLAAFYTVGSGLGLSGFGIRRALTIYLFSMVVSIFLGGVLPSLGLVELSGQAAARAWGYTVTQGLSLMIGWRLVWMGSIWLICGPVLLLLRKEIIMAERTGSA